MHSKINKVGILTWHYYSNFGSALQAYALQTTISSLGYKVDFINYHNPIFGKVSRLMVATKLCLSKTVGRLPFKFAKHFTSGKLLFEHRYLHCGQMTQDAKELTRITAGYFAIVCGSDQIWAPNVYNPVYFASFADHGIRKIAYAASIGLNDIPNDLVAKYKAHLADFYAVGVREEKGKSILKERCGIDATVVLDPTLLLRANDYEYIERKPLDAPKEKFLFVYLLNENHQYENRIKCFAEKMDLPIVGISAKKSDERWINELSKLGADEFIWLVHHSEVVMTDSYHGAIFSLLFHKNVYIFQRFLANDPINQNSRIRQLQVYFGLEDHVIDTDEDVENSRPIDFENFEKQLNQLRELSINFLCHALA